MAIIIAGFATCGKSVLGRKYKNVIDLESSAYKHLNFDKSTAEQSKGTKRELNPQWPQNYYDAISKACKKYDVVLVQLKPEHFDYFDEHNIEYSIAYPNINNWDEIERRAIGRGNNQDFVNGLRRVLVPFYEDAIKRNYKKLYILNNNETLEDCLLREGIKLSI